MENQKNEVVTKEVKVVESKVDLMKTMVEETVVENEEQLNAVSDKIKEVKDTGKLIKAEMAKTVDPAKEIIQATKDRFQPFLLSCTEAEAGLKKKAETFMVAEKKKKDDEALKIANQVDTGYIKPETAVEKIEEVGEVKKTASTGRSSLSMRMIKSAGAIDESKVPEEYFTPRQLDMVKINKVIKAGVEIPGVEIKETPSMASR